MNHKRNQQGFHYIGILLIIVLGVIGLVGWRVYQTRGPFLSQAEKEGKQYSNNTCSGNAIKKLDHLPIGAANITTVLPYGGTVGAHVMPISHGYIWPGAFNSPRDSFNVYAMADSTLYSISSRSINVDTGKTKKTEYSLGFSVSCTEFYYYDLMTSLSPDLQKLIDAHPSQESGGNSVGVNIAVKSGQLLGKIGGQTLDYAVWDFTKSLTGIVVPEHYKGDFPRIHLVDPFEYETPSVKQAMLAKTIRTATPVAGKVDYDIDGRLVGGWFQEGSKFYEQGKGPYWAGHLAVVPNELDPTFMTISTGTYEPGKEAQFGISRDAPDPRTVGIETGLVKYDLFQTDFTLADGSHWDRMSVAKDVRAKTNGPVRGCAAFQLTETRKLKAEFFPSKACAEVTAFTSAARTYIR